MKKLLCLIITTLLLFPLTMVAKGTLTAKIVLDRDKVYVGDSVVVWVMLYTSSPIAKAECTTDFSVKGKCNVTKVDIDRNSTVGRMRQGGNTYYTMLWNQYVVVPQKTGNYTIPTQKFKAFLKQLVSMPDLFEEMMGAVPMYKVEKVEGVSSPLTFEVKERPLRSTQEMMRSGSGVI